MLLREPCNAESALHVGTKPVLGSSEEREAIFLTKRRAIVAVAPLTKPGSFANPEKHVIQAHNDVCCGDVAKFSD